MCFILTVSVGNSSKQAVAYGLLIEVLWVLVEVQSSRQAIWLKILKIFILVKLASLPLLINPIEILRNILKDLCKTLMPNNRK